MPRLRGFQWVPGPVKGFPYRDDDFNWKIVWHSTQTKARPGAAAALARIHKTPPQLWVDVFSRERVQCIDTSLAGYALRNNPGGADTNADRVIQIELVGFDTQMGDLTAADLAWLATTVVQPILEHHPVRPNFRVMHATGAGGNMASVSSKIRLSAAEYDNFAGHLGHQHVPENAHTDPGALDIARIIEFAYLAAPTPAPQPVKEWDEMATRQEIRDEIHAEAHQIVTALTGNQTSDYWNERSSILTHIKLGTKIDEVAGQVEAVASAVAAVQAGGADPQVIIDALRDTLPDAVWARLKAGIAAAV